MPCGTCAKIRNAIKITVRFIPARRPGDQPRPTITRLGNSKIVRQPDAK